MNIVCNNCSTKYSLADERVADGVYQTPCKRCGAAMVIRKQAGESGSAHQALQALRAQRSENSLLFSLNDLATTAERLSPIAGTESADNGRTEGSGLLDIRRMAASYHNDQSRPSTSSSHLFAPMAAPPAPLLFDSSLVAARVHQKSPVWWLVGGATGIAAAVLAVVAVMVLKGGLGGRDAQASTSKPAVASGQARPTLLAAVQPATLDPATTVTTPATVTKPVTEPAKPALETTARPSERTRRRRHSREQRTTVDAKEQPTEQETAPPKKGCLDEVGCLLASDPPACCRKYTSVKPKPDPTTVKPDPRLPKKLERADIKASMSKTLARVTACGSRSAASGQVTVSIKVDGDGSVAGVTVKQAPDTALGKCVAKAVSKTTFPKTQTGGSFSYPFLF
jgi:TonB family protein